MCFFSFILRIRTYFHTCCEDGSLGLQGNGAQGHLGQVKSLPVCFPKCKNTMYIAIFHGEMKVLCLHETLQWLRQHSRLLYQQGTMLVGFALASSPLSS